MKGALQLILRTLHHLAAVQHLGTPSLGESERALLDALEVFDDESVNAHGGKLVVDPAEARPHLPTNPHPVRGNHLPPRRDPVLKVFLGREY